MNERVRAKQGVAIVVKEDLWEYVRECKEVSPRLMWVRMKIGCLIWVFVAAYAPDMGSTNENERDAFWELLNECLEGFSASERVMVMGDLNARVGDSEVEGIVGKYGVPRVNENGERLVEICAEREFVIGNTWFKKKECKKYTWERGEQKGMIDLILISRAHVKSLLKVEVKRGMAGGMSDHHLVRAEVRVNGEWCGKRKRLPGKEVIKGDKLREDECKGVYKGFISGKWREVDDSDVLSVEDEWRRMRECILEGAREACGTRVLGNGRVKRGSEWWNEEVAAMVREKRVLFNKYLQNKSVDNWERYRRKHQEVKRRVEVLKREANERWGARVSECFRENKKMFWKEVNCVRKRREAVEVKVKDETGELVSGDEAA